MIVICKSKMPDGTDIQIEDWRIDYPEIVGYILAAYPESTKNQFMVKAGDRQRVSFDFVGEETTKSVFSLLESGQKKLSDYNKYLCDPRKAGTFE